MQTLRKLIIIFFVGPVLFSSCEKSASNDQNNDPTEENNIVDRDIPDDPQEKSPQDKVTEILQAYYHDLSAAQINEDEYFAPTVEKFFSSENLPRQKVAQSIRNGFSGFDSRDIKIYRESMVIEPNGDGYVAEFSGVSVVKRTGSEETERQEFKNRVTFNSDFEITRYESLGAPNTSRQTARSIPTQIQAAKEILSALSSGKYEQAAKYIHPKIGYYFVTQPGAMSVPYKCSDLNTMVSYASWFKNGIPNLGTDLKEEALPGFNCGDLFSKEGTFIAEVSDYSAISSLMGALNRAEVGNYDEKLIGDVKSLEKYITWQIIDTYSATSLLLGNIDGKWYLLGIDIAAYDCSA